MQRYTGIGSRTSTSTTNFWTIVLVREACVATTRTAVRMIIHTRKRSRTSTRTSITLVALYRTSTSTGD
eukprot:scaffold200931_cov19-Prasinocladus_malaysianus.AAC.1